MENKLIMPAECEYLTEAEERSTEGGWFIIDDIAALVFGLEMGQYAKNNPSAGLGDIFNKGLAPAKSRWGSILTPIICIVNPIASGAGLLIGMML